MKNLILVCFLLSIFSANAQSPIWPLATNPHNYDPAFPVPSEVVDWLNFPTPNNSVIPNGPLNVGHGPAIGGFDCCGNMLFYVIHSGSNNDNELWVRNSSGVAVLFTSPNSTTPIGLNGVRSDAEIQVIPVPGKCDEWFIVYLENRQSGLSVQRNFYNTKRLLYSHVKYISSNNMQIVGSALNIPITRPGMADEYQHGKAATTNSLYVIRRRLDFNSSTGHIAPAIDKFNITASGFTYAFSNTGSTIQNIPYYSQTGPSSPLELNNAGTELAFLNYDETTRRSYLFTFGITATSMIQTREIHLEATIIKPNANLLSPPSGYFGPATNYNLLNYPSSNTWLNANALSGSSTLNLRFIYSFSSKLSDIQYSPNGNLIYVLQGGYSRPGLNNLTYLAQVDLNSFSATNNSVIAALKIQTAKGVNSGTINSGEGSSWNSALDSNYYESHALGKIESAVDNNLYFTKIGSNKLFVLPQPNTVWPSSDLYAREIDLSTPAVPNINTKNDVLFLPDHIDGHNYSPVSANISFPGVNTTVCVSSTPIQLTATPTGGTWSGSTKVTPNGSFTPNPLGSYTLTYTVNGCFKTITITVDECANCCPNFQAVLKDSNNCKITFAPVPKPRPCPDTYQSMVVTLTNGYFLSGGVAPSCTGATYTPTSYVGLSTVTITNLCGITSLSGIDVNVQAINCNRRVIVKIAITMASGRKCEAIDSLKCLCNDCCAKVDAKFFINEPDQNLKTGKFTITNLLPSSPICKVSIAYSPGGNFIPTSNSLMINGISNSTVWTANNIPATGNFSTPVSNTIMFSIHNLATYNGIVTITVTKCDSSTCTFRINWKGIKPNADPVDLIPVHKAASSGLGLFAYQLGLKANSAATSAIKYISVAFADREQIERNQLEFFAISGASHPVDPGPANLHSFSSTLMGRHSAFFELSSPLLLKPSDSTKVLNIVGWAKKGVEISSRLRFTLLDEEGEIIKIGQFNVSNVDGEVVTSSVDLDADKPEELLEIFAVYPNPAENDLNVKYILGKAQNIQIALYGANGALIKELFHGHQQSGLHELNLDVSNLPNASYLLKLNSDRNASSIQFVVAK